MLTLSVFLASFMAAFDPSQDIDVSQMFCEIDKQERVMILKQADDSVVLQSSKCVASFDMLEGKFITLHLATPDHMIEEGYTSSKDPALNAILRIWRKRSKV